MKTYIPNRNDIVWLDFEPVKGKEIGKYRPALVLSSIEKTTDRFTIKGIEHLDNNSVVAASLIQTLSWTDRKAKLITQGEKGVLDQVLLRLIPLIGAGDLVENIINEQLS